MFGSEIVERDSFYTKKVSKDSRMSASRIAPDQITKQLSAWWISFWFWNITHYVLGLASSICTVLIAKNSYEDFPNMPVFVAVATAAMTFMKSDSKANSYIAAWRVLNAERIEYELDPSYSDSKLAKEHKRCESIIGKSD